MKTKYFYACCFVLAAILGFMFFYKLGSHPLADYDESIYAQVAQESFLNHNQLGFTWLGNVGLYRSIMWFEKPPLMIWLIETSYKIFGITEFAARLWSAFFALATVLLTFYFILKKFKSRVAAIISLACYFIAFQFLFNAGVLQFDIAVTFFIFASLVCFWFAKEHPRYFYFFWILLGLGVMAKSVIGLLPIPIVGLYSIFSWDWNYLKQKKFWFGLIAFFAIILPWHILETIRYGNVFWEQYFGYHVFERYATALEGNKGPFSFYWDILSEQRALLYLGLPSLAYFIYKALKEKGVYILNLVAIIFVFLFFSTAQTKLKAYILVIYPYLIILVAVSLDRLISFIETKSRTISAISLWAFIVLCVFLGLRYNEYRLTVAKDPYFENSKEVGLYLKNHYTNEPVYYYSATGTKPMIIFYSNRVLYFLKYPSPKPVKNFILVSEIKPDFKSAKPVFETSRVSVYLVN